MSISFHVYPAGKKHVAETVTTYIPYVGTERNMFYFFKASSSILKQGIAQVA